MLIFNVASLTCLFRAIPWQLFPGGATAKKVEGPRVFKIPI